MAEFIEREKALEECDWYANEFCECEYAIMPLKGALEIIPAADVRPVVRGHWVYEEPNGANSFKGAYWCDLCHQPESYRKNFCPNCGAMMEES